MDKGAVITAYREGMISLLECAQILGLDSSQMEQVLGSIKPDIHVPKSSSSRLISLMGSK